MRKARSHRKGRGAEIKGSRRSVEGAMRARAGPTRVEQGIDGIVGYARKYEGYWKGGEYGRRREKWERERRIWIEEWVEGWMDEWRILRDMDGDLYKSNKMYGWVSHAKCGKVSTGEADGWPWGLQDAEGGGCRHRGKNRALGERDRRRQQSPNHEISFG